MKTVKKIAVCGFVCLAWSIQAPQSARADWGPSFATVHSSEQSQALYEARAERTIDEFVGQSIGNFEKSNRTFLGPAIAKVVRGVDLDSVSRAILADSTRVYGLPGSDFQLLGPLCRRKGDYDFALAGVVRLAYLVKNYQRSLSQEAWNKLVYTLLSQKGNEHHTTYNIGICGTHDDTENHILLTESARFLTNQLLMHESEKLGFYLDPKLYDNKQNGFEDWLSARLQKVFIEDMDEYNSRPYEGLSYLALQNLYDFSESEKVKTMAAGVLHYLSAKHAIQNSLLRKLAPYKRQPKYVFKDEITVGDTALPRYWLLVGNIESRGHEASEFLQYLEPFFMLFPATGTYRLPKPIIDLYFKNFDQGSLVQTFSHDGVEIYDVHPGAVVTAGGIYFNFKADYGLMIMDGWAYPTTLMPIGSAKSYKELIRFDGHFLPTKKKNTCVTKNFACGLDPHIPASIPAKCQLKSGKFTFIDMVSDGCPNEAKLFVAMYQAKCDSFRCRMGASKWGFWEISDRKNSESLADFAAEVLARNGATQFDSGEDNRYIQRDGTAIVFRPVVKGFYENPILAINGKAQPASFRDFGLAEGDFINASRNGFVEIQNPLTGKMVVIDARDYHNPQVSVQE